MFVRHRHRDCSCSRRDGFFNLTRLFTSFNLPCISASLDWEREREAWQNKVEKIRATGQRRNDTRRRTNTLGWGGRGGQGWFQSWTSTRSATCMHHAFFRSKRRDELGCSSTEKLLRGHRFTAISIDYKYLPLNAEVFVHRLCNPRVRTQIDHKQGSPHSNARFLLTVTHGYVHVRCRKGRM